jgi:spermidine/putrescine transport system substrate-binding protein
MRVLLVLLSFGIFAFGNVLYVYNWSEYMPQSVIQAFQKETGIRVYYSTYDSNEAMYAKVKTDQSSSYDILVPSTYFVNKMSKEGMLAVIDVSKLSNYKNLDESLLHQPFDPDNKYSVPYLWGSTGISFNARVLGEGAIKSWEDLWSEKYKKSLLLTDDLREVFGMALKTLGYSANTQNPQEIAKAYEKLKLLMPNVKLYNSESPKEFYLGEEVAAGMNFNGENYMANLESPDIHYVYPKEGILLWMDSLVIPTNAKNVENAHKFIDFLLRPEIAKEISEEVGYASPNMAAIELLDDEVRNNPIIYPTKEDLKNSEFQVDLGEALSLYESYWEQLKTGQ